MVAAELAGRDPRGGDRGGRQLMEGGRVSLERDSAGCQMTAMTKQ